jgi:hypothetical protein
MVLLPAAVPGLLPQQESEHDKEKDEKKLAVWIYGGK